MKPSAWWTGLSSKGWNGRPTYASMTGQLVALLDRHFGDNVATARGLRLRGHVARAAAL